MAENKTYRTELISRNAVKMVRTLNGKEQRTEMGCIVQTNLKLEVSYMDDPRTILLNFESDQNVRYVNLIAHIDRIGGGPRP